MTYTLPCGTAVGTLDWTNWTPAFLADVDALLSGTTLPPADPGKATCTNFGFAVPTGATVLSVEVQTTGTRSNNGTITLELTYDGVTPVESSGALAPGASHTFASIPTPAQANASTFGLLVTIGGTMGTMAINQILIELTDDSGRLNENVRYIGTQGVRVL